MARNIAQKIFKVIALVSSPSEMKPLFEQLRVRNILVYPIGSVESALQIFASGGVDYCLFSVDHPTFDIYEQPQKIESEYNIPVIAISELRDKQSMWRLTKVKTKNILYAKANAQNIFQRIQLIRSAEQALRSKGEQLAIAAEHARLAKLRDSARAEIRRENNRKAADKNGRANNVVLFSHPTSSENKTRLLTPPLNKLIIGSVRLSEETTYSLAPVKTKFTEIMSAPARLLAPLTSAAAFQRLEFVTTSREVKTIGHEDIAQALYRVAPPPEDVQKIILGCLTNALAEFCNPNELTQRENEFGRSMVISINSKSLIGTFIIAAQSDVPKLGDIQTQLYEYLRTFGFDWEQEEIQVEVLTDQKIPLDLITAGVYVAGVATEGEVAISYYPEAVKVPQLQLTNSTQHVLDPANLVKNTRLNFDIFLHLKINSRDIHYMKVGTDISDKQIEKLKAGSLTPFVPRNQLSNLNEYVLLQRLLKLVNPEDLDDEIIELLRIS